MRESNNEAMQELKRDRIQKLVEEIGGLEKDKSVTNEVVEGLEK